MVNNPKIGQLVRVISSTSVQDDIQEIIDMIGNVYSIDDIIDHGIDGLVVVIDGWQFGLEEIEEA